ncbi:MAG: aminotransferase class III-fold pyridoxal phosphate-dependent enzyme [Bacteroidia bacterium]|nr:aminotransferase class III-fold pyridoxal phosphate-dependent enzyme [Bacteroidia bacterium]
MELFDVYQQYDIAPVRGSGMHVWDEFGRAYLDFYGGHAVISIGHGHPHYLEALREQLDRLVFYSNAVRNPLQERLARLLGEQSGYADYRLFLCNSGAEANENALKIASFHGGRSGVIAFTGAFHGRTSAAVQITDNPGIRAPLNHDMDVRFIHMNSAEALEQALRERPAAAVIVEGIQGVEGVVEAGDEFLRDARALCDCFAAMLILDEVQSGYGRTGDFFAHQRSGIRPDLITIAKGMGNGFPVAGVLIHPDIAAKRNMLGTTFGGSHLACAAAIAVLEVLRDENLAERAAAMGEILRSAVGSLPGVREVRGRGLMLGIALDRPAAPLRKALLQTHSIFTGSATRTDTIRLLPPLVLTEEHAMEFAGAFGSVLSSTFQSATA